MKLFLAFCLLFISIYSSAEEGWLKKRLKEKWIKKQYEQSAPLASRDTSTPITKSGTYTFGITFQNQERYYKIYLPPTYNPLKPIPLIFAFHGGGGNMEIQSKEKFYKLTTIADKEGFGVVFPNGYSRFKSGKVATWNAGNCCGEARNKEIDDVGFIREVFNKLKAQLNLDLKKVYAIGMSNGAMMSYQLACEASDIFKAIGAVAGTDNTLKCAPDRPVSILHIHALNDDHVQYQGGRGKKAASKEYVPEFVSVQATLHKWKKILKCKDDFKVTSPKIGVEIQDLQNCQNGSQIKHIKLSDGGHSWPGGVKPRGTDETSKLISANEEIWTFFKALP